MYQYIDKDPKVGDVVLWESDNPEQSSPYIEFDKPYLVCESGNYNETRIVDETGKLRTLGPHNRKVIKTLPGSQAKPGDHCIRITGGNKNTPDGTVITVTRTSGQYAKLHWGDRNSNWSSQFLVLVKKEKEIEDTPYSDLELYSKEYYEFWEKQYQLGAKLLCSTNTSRQMNQKYSCYKENSSSPLRWYEHCTDDKLQFEFAKEETMNIQDYIIDIKNTSLADRLRLRQVLLDNNQALYSGTSLFKAEPSSNQLHYSNREWALCSPRSTNISLEDFIQKFKKSNVIRNLAFTTSNTDGFTSKQIENIVNFVGDSSYGIEELVGVDLIADCGTSSKGIFMDVPTTSTPPSDYLKVSYEQVFPKDSQYKCSAEPIQTQTKKEETMNPNEIDMTDARPQSNKLEQVLKELFGVQAVTDLKNKPKCVAHVFNGDEELVEIVAVDSDEAAAALLSDNIREYIDYTIVTYKMKNKHTLNIPVKTEKA